MNKEIKYILLMFVILMVLFSFPLIFNNKDIDNTLPEVKLKGIKSSKSFAIMVQNENSYEKYEKNTWPDERYKFKEAKCMDNNGLLVENAVSFDSETKTVILETDKTVVCTLYFDKSIIGKLRENDPNKVLSTEEVGEMYRYQGVGVEEGINDTHKLVDNNYICFGTNDINKCNCNTEENCDKYMYRIIGLKQESYI